MKKYKKGYVQGTFDLFHIGHLNLLRRAKEQCDFLLVGVVSDELSKMYKGITPYIPYKDRAAIVEAIRYVDQVIQVNLDNEDKLKICDQYHYDCHFCGDDHTGWDTLIAELKRRGADVVFFPYTQKTSSTQIKRDLRNQGRYGLADTYPCERLPQRVALYGAGKLGRDLYQRLQEMSEHTVTLWVDKKGEQAKALGFPVELPQRLLEGGYEKVILGVKNRKVAAEIQQELLAMGIGKEKIFWTELPKS